MESDAPVALEGGRTTAAVVRIGDTVRRPTGPHSAFVHRVLEHLATRRFVAAPTFLGIDDRGREIVSFIAGDVPRDLGLYSDRQLTAAAALLHRLHDATADFASTKPGEVVCHGDASPCNHVFRDGLPVALIDFDAAFVGARRDDLGYAAWLWLDLGDPDIDAGEQGRRLAVFVDAYGAPRSDAIDAVLDAQAALARRASRPEVRDWALACRRRICSGRTALAESLFADGTSRTGDGEPSRAIPSSSSHHAPTDRP